MLDIMLKIKKYYKICWHVYQSLFIEIADIFIQYKYLTTWWNWSTWLRNKIKWVRSSIYCWNWEFCELLYIFQMLYYFNGRLPLTNGLLLVPDGETPELTEKISMKTLYELFKDKKSHGSVSLQFLLALNRFLIGDIQISKDVTKTL